MIAVLEPVVIRSTPAVVRSIVSVPLVTVGVAWNACARTRCGSQATASAMLSEQLCISLRRAAERVPKREMVGMIVLMAARSG